jgi:antitoxin ChpS
MFAIPKPILEGLGMSPNSQVGLSVSDGRLIVEPLHRPRYTLAKLIAECDLTASLLEESRAWLDADAVCREAL